jgi:glycosyltransferase involved in cell wall biosynthesis
MLYSGRLAHEKGIAGIVKVFASVIKEIPELKLILLGDGPEKNNIIQYAHKYQLTIGNEEYNQIILKGSVANPYTYIKNASLTVLNSKSEGFPNAMAESLLAGKLVVAGDCPYGPREIFALGEGKEIIDKHYPIETGGGILLPPIDESSLILWVNSIIKIVNEKKTCDKLFVRRFQEKTSQENFIKNWKSILKG